MRENRGRAGEGPKQRRGSALVEFAIVLPVLAILILGALDLGRGIMVQHALQEAAHASCRVYSIRDSTQQDATDMVANAMTRAAVAEYATTYDPPSKGDIDTHMEAVTVTVTTPFSTVAWLPPLYLSGATITGSCTLPADLGVANDTPPAVDLSIDDHGGDGNMRHGDDDDD